MTRSRDNYLENRRPEGKRILAWARTLLAAHDGLQAEASACRGQLVGTLRLGVVPLCGFDPMRLISIFTAKYPHLRFQLFALSSEQILERLSSNQLELGLSYLTSLDRTHFTSLELAETRMGLLYDDRYFTFETTELGWEALVRLPLGLLSGGMHFRQSIDHGFRSRGLAVSPLLETDAVHILLQSVQAGLFCAVIPLNSGLEGHHQHLRLVTIEDAQTLAPLGLILRRTAPRSALGDACFAEAQALLGRSQIP